jgi:hypothetical protein
MADHVTYCEHCGEPVARDRGLLLTDADVVDVDGGPLDDRDELLVPADRLTGYCDWSCLRSATKLRVEAFH